MFTLQAAVIVAMFYDGVSALILSLIYLGFFLLEEMKVDYKEDDDHLRGTK
jgi:hypothetical protein